jgi:glycosyltransferase involved in cell wall biosynthesis
MKQVKELEPIQPHLVWVFPGRLDTYLSAATWLRTTHELRNLGWRVSLINAGQSGIQTVRGVEIISLPGPDIYLLRQIIFHLNVLGFIFSNWSSIDLILTGQPSALLILPLKLLRIIQRKRKPLLVMDTRTIPMEDLRKASMRDKLRGWFSNLMNRFGNSWADGQTAITQRMAECVHIPSHRLWGIWPSGVDLEQFTDSFGNRKWPTGDEPIHLAYIGVLHYERNLMSLCKAAEMANKEGKNFIVSLTGWGTAREDLESFASLTNGRIRVNPTIPNDQIPGLLEKVHVGVLPFPDEDKYKVCSPVKLFEYMAAGLPILATRIVCFTDVIGNGTYTFWAEDATPEGLLSSLRLIWTSRSSLKRMGSESATAAHFWTWKESAGKLSEALDFGLRQAAQLNQKGFISRTTQM